MSNNYFILFKFAVLQSKYTSSNIYVVTTSI